MSNELKTVMSFCLKQASQVPVAQRVSLYRGLAEFCGSPEIAAQIYTMADALDAADRACRQFIFNFENPLPPSNQA